MNEFAGPADTGIYSNSVQQTAFDMGKFEFRGVKLYRGAITFVVE